MNFFKAPCVLLLLIPPVFPLHKRLGFFCGLKIEEKKVHVEQKHELQP